MRHPILYILVLVLGAVAAWAPAASFADEKPGTKTAPGTKQVAVRRALIKTSMGDIEVELWPQVAPQTVRVFLGLADGKGTFPDVRNPSKTVTIDKPFYDGIKFHRVIKGFMLQGGCPRGTGTGDPGFWFADEINAKALGLDKIKAFQNGRPHGWLGLRSQREFQQRIGLPLLKQMGINPSDQSAIQARQADLNAKLAAMTLKDAYELMGYRYNDKLPSKKPLKGYLALANSGPNTNGSQFFINLVDTPHLTGKHTVFGRVTKGMDVVEKIGVVPVDPKSAKPIKDVRILSIRSMP